MLIPSIAQFRRRRGAAKSRALSPAPLAVTVVSVSQIDEQRALWTFSAAVLSVEDGSGLLIGGLEPESIEGITPEGALQVEYAGELAVGYPWELSGGLSFTFANGGTLTLPESGFVV